MERDEILDAIRKCAADNEGRPVGQRRFVAESGVSRYELAHHWRSYGDAVQEAGLVPNAFNANGFSTEHVLEHLALYVRDLGHYPVDTELQMRRQKRDDFPSGTVFKRLGRKRDVISLLHAYCIANPDFSDVAEICAPLIEHTDAEQQPTRDDVTADGYVYLIQHGSRREYKIGATNDLSRRSREIRIELPLGHSVVHSFRTDDPFGVEAYWHNRFRERRMNGEWYALTASDVRAFKRRKQFM